MGTPTEALSQGVYLLPGALPPDILGSVLELSGLIGFDIDLWIRERKPKSGITIKRTHKDIIWASFRSPIQSRSSRKNEMKNRPKA